MLAKNQRNMMKFKKILNENKKLLLSLSINLNNLILPLNFSAK